MKSSSAMRTLLDPEAQQALEKMIERLKESGHFLKINPSRLTSWIVCQFLEDGFEKSLPLILQDHFNSKEYLRNLVKNFSEADDLEKFLKETLQQIKPTRLKNAKKQNQKEAQAELE